MNLLPYLHALFSVLPILFGPVRAQFLGPELSQVISEQYVLFTECQSFIQTCPPTIASCATAVCAECTGLGDKPLNSCCQQPTPTACFITAFGNGATITTAPITTTADPNQLACASISNAIVACESATPGFDNLANSIAASCLCYAGTTSWIPNVFDGWASSCAAFASTADTSDLAGIQSIEGFCSSVGNVIVTGASSSPSALPSSSAMTGAGSTQITAASTTNPSTAAVTTTSAAAASSTTAPTSTMTTEASTTMTTAKSGASSQQNWFQVQYLFVVVSGVSLLLLI